MSIFTKAFSEPEKVTVAVPEIGVPTQEYNRLASKLGVITTDDFRQKRHDFLKFLHDELVQVYPMGSVHRYMVKMARKAGTSYVWKPAREVDQAWLSLNSIKMPDSYPDEKPEQVIPFRERLRVGLGDTYRMPVPYPVLKTMELFQDKFAKDVVMMITDYEVVHPDPFLGIYHIPTRSFVVVEKWDEPSYRMED